MYKEWDIESPVKKFQEIMKDPGTQKHVHEIKEAYRAWMDTMTDKKELDPRGFRKQGADANAEIAEFLKKWKIEMPEDVENLAQSLNQELDKFYQQLGIDGKDEEETLEFKRQLDELSRVVNSQRSSVD